MFGTGQATTCHSTVHVEGDLGIWSRFHGADEVRWGGFANISSNFFQEVWRKRPCSSSWLLASLKNNEKPRSAVFHQTLDRSWVLSCTCYQPTATESTDGLFRGRRLGLRCLRFRRLSAALGPKSTQELSLEVTPVDSEAKSSAERGGLSFGGTRGGKRQEFWTSSRLDGKPATCKNMLSNQDVCMQFV